MRYIPMILLWLLADVSLCFVVVGVVGSVVATISMMGLTDAGVAGSQMGRAAVIGFKVAVLHLPY